jgi:hypothetical protein
MSMRYRHGAHVIALLALGHGWSAPSGLSAQSGASAGMTDRHTHENLPIHEEEWLALSASPEHLR